MAARRYEISRRVWGGGKKYFTNEPSKRVEYTSHSPPPYPGNSLLLDHQSGNKWPWKIRFEVRGYRTSSWITHAQHSNEYPTNFLEFYFRQFTLFLKPIKIDLVTELPRVARFIKPVRKEDSRHEIACSCAHVCTVLVSRFANILGFQSLFQESFLVAGWLVSFGSRTFDSTFISNAFKKRWFLLV